ncbi:MAG TPA: Gmad2 immunoglobulin-like domain-containing protein [Candidatus Paceibacterota bacterium]|nr:Gmad2 immunoglobulin-like domain-containing protein [Candidatus Paceibacterota bacterium]
MKNKNFTKIIAVFLVIAIALVIFIFIYKNNKPNSQNNNVNINTEVEGNKQDLIYFSITPGQKVSGLTTFVGSVKNAYFFEANILVNVLDANKNVLKSGHANATTDWMTTEPVSFEGNIDFSGLPKGPAYIEIHNDNASGLPENDKNILIPIIIE